MTPLTPDGATPPLREPPPWLVGLGIVVLVLLGLALAGCERRRHAPAAAEAPTTCEGGDCAIPGG